MRAAEWADNAATHPIMDATKSAEDGNGELLASLAGKRASRERAVAQTTRRVVLTSLGVMQEQSASRRRSRALALAVLLLALLAVGPFVWHVTEDLLGGEHMADIATQTSLWICILCPAILAAVIVAGWARSKP